MKLNRYAVLLIIFLSVFNYGNLSAGPGQRYDSQKIKTIIPSNTRITTELSGSWQKSINKIDWESAQVPSTDYNKEKVYYMKNLQFDNSTVKNYTWSLYFLGIDDNVEVYLNEQLIGKYFGGMTPFTVKIPQNLINQKNNTLMLVIAQSDEFSNKIRMLHTYSKMISIGSVREIFLVGTPHIWIKDINYKTKLNESFTNSYVNSKVNIASGEINSLLSQAFMKDSLGLKMNGKATVDISAQIRNKQTGETVSDAGTRQVEFENERAVTLSFDFNISNPKLWSPASPNLYEIVIKVTKAGKLIDEYAQALGIYDFKTYSGDRAGFMLNGSPIILKGVDYIEDHSGTGQSLSPYRMEQDVILMKTLGANLIRFKHSAPHPYFAFLCDKYGMFFSVETPNYNVPTNMLNLYEIKSRFKNIAERLTGNYDNHPSLLAYGLGEGIIEGTPESIDYFNSIGKAIRSTSSKPIFKSILIGTKDLITEGIDFIVIKDSRKFLSYEVLNQKIQSIKEKAKGKPLVINYGFPIQPYNSNGYTDPLTVEAQRYYILTINNIVKNNSIAGSVFWSFNDFEVNNPLMLTNNNDQFLCSSGLLDRNRRQRLSYSTLQIIFTDQSEQPILTAGSYSESTPYIFLIAGIFTAIALVLFVRRFKRFREYLFRAILRPYNFYADIRDQRIISIGQTFWLAAINSITVGLFFSAIMYYFRTSDAAQALYSLIFPFEWLQKPLYRLIWMPELLSLIIAAIGFLFVFALSGIIRLFALFVKSKIYYTDTITITVWASTPLILLLPISVILIKILVIFPILALFFLAIAALVYVWIIFRIMKAVAVVFDVRNYISYSIGCGFIFIVAFFKLLYLNSAVSIFSYFSYLISYIMNI